MQKTTPTNPHNTSEQLVSLKHNISQLARQLEVEKRNTNISDDRRFWVLENKHLSRLLQERDSTIKSLKKISQEKAGQKASVEKRGSGKGVEREQYCQRIDVLERQVRRLKRMVNGLSQLCQLLESTVESQEKQIGILENLSGSKRSVTQYRLQQNKLRYQYLSQQLTHKLSRDIVSNSSEFKNSFGLQEIIRTQSNEFQDCNTYSKGSIDSQISNLQCSEGKEYHKGRKEMVSIRRQIDSLKDAIARMKEKDDLYDQVVQTSTKQETSKKQSATFQSISPFEQSSAKRNQVTIDLKKKTTEVQQYKYREGREKGEGKEEVERRERREKRRVAALARSLN